MTHEIRTPLNAILGLTEILQEGLKEEKNMELIKDIRSSGEVLLALVSDILDISKLNENKFDIHPSAVKLEDVLKQIYSTYAPLTAGSEVELKIDTSKIRESVYYLDELRVKQVLNNLLSNALKFTERGKIVVTCSYNHPHLYFEVCDTGIGIEEESLGLIFDSFQQVDSTLSKKFRGTGLGLSIVKQIVEQMDGEVSVESTVNVGTKFKFYIHAEKTDQAYLAGVRKVDIDEEAFKKLRILVAEDNQLNYKVISKYLKNFACQFDHAKDGREAVDKALDKEYDIILMDLQMPHLDGIEASLKIRESLGEKSAIHDCLYCKCARRCEIKNRRSGNERLSD